MECFRLHKLTNLERSVISTDNDNSTWLVKAWKAIDWLSVICKSDLLGKIKPSFFHAVVVPILLYGCTPLTLTKRKEKKLDGNYTRILRPVLYKSWRQHPTKQQRYDHLPPIRKTIQIRQKRHAGHSWRCKNKLMVGFLLWTPSHGRVSVSRPART